MKKKTNKQKQNQNKTKSTFESNTFAFGFVYAKHRDRLKKVVQKPAEIPGHKKSWANICFSVDLFFWRAYYRPGRGGLLSEGIWRFNDTWFYILEAMSRVKKITRIQVERGGEVA